jgi:hypothetical protein
MGNNKSSNIPNQGYAKRVDKPIQENLVQERQSSLANNEISKLISPYFDNKTFVYSRSLILCKK